MTMIETEQQGESRGSVSSGGVTYYLTVDADGPLAPDDAVLLAVGQEWERRVADGEPWSRFDLNGPEGSFTVNIRPTTGDVTDEAAAAAAAAFVEKVGGETRQPVTPGDEQPAAAALHPAVADLLEFFQWHIVDDEASDAIDQVRAMYGALAEWTARVVPSGPEQTVAIRKLLEAKDCAVRATFPKA